MDDRAGPFPSEVVNAAMKAAYEVVTQRYPAGEYLPLMVMIPVNRRVLKEAKWNSGIDAALRQMVKDMADALQWPTE